MSNINKQEIFKKYGSNETDTGSVYSQVALFTSRIQHLTDHLKNNKKDFWNSKITSNNGR